MAGCAMDPEHHRRLERMYLAAPVSQEHAPEIEVDRGRARVVLPVQERFFHAAGALHGSVVFKALDDAAFFAANSLVEDVFVLTVSFEMHLLRPISQGHLTGTARVVHDGQEVLVAEAEAVDDQGRLVARGTGSFLPSHVELTEEIGYR